MSEAQISALEALLGRALTEAEREALAQPVKDRNDVAVAALLSAGRTKVQQPHMVSARGLAAMFPGGPIAAELVLLKLEGAEAKMRASEDPQQKVIGSLLGRQLGFLKGDGLDFGAPALRGMLDQFAALGILGAADAAGLKSLALVPDPLPVAAVSLALNTAEGRPVL